jgi:subtilisin family serine protease
MAKEKRRNMAKEQEKTNVFGIPTTGAEGVPSEPQFTGRYLVLLTEGAESVGKKTVAKAAGLKSIASSEDFTSEEFGPEDIAGADGLVLSQISVMVVEGDPDSMAAVADLPQDTGGVQTTEPEQICYATQLDSGSGFAATPDYVRGYRDGVNRLADALLAGKAAAEELISVAWIETQFTWGLQATRVPVSSFSGKGIRVAVLDTGMDLKHPDFAGRSISSRSFVPGQSVQDGHGHGTHCIGTACGPRKPPLPPAYPPPVPRYGIAHEAAICVGKVLSNQGSGGDAGILTGINWAVRKKCQVVSMSLGAPVPVGASPSFIYEMVARRALKLGTLIIAAAGNDSNRPGTIRPVSRPANCPSIMAVASLDENLGVSYFSNGGINPNGGEINIAAPGRNVFSSWPMTTRYRRISGTSMATPHVAGIAALYCQKSNAKGTALWNMLLNTAKHLPLPARDVGAGLVQAP